MAEGVRIIETRVCTRERTAVWAFHRRPTSTSNAIDINVSCDSRPSIPASFSCVVCLPMILTCQKGGFASRRYRMPHARRVGQLMLDAWEA